MSLIKWNNLQVQSIYHNALAKKCGLGYKLRFLDENSTIFQLSHLHPLARCSLAAPETRYADIATFLLDLL